MALNRLVFRGVRSAHLRPAGALRPHSTHSETEDYIVFPRERPGLDMSLNWSLNKNGVTPLGDAYRWTKASHASKFGAKADKVEKDTPAPEAKEEAGTNELGFPEFDAAIADVKDLLTTENSLFVAEGEAASSGTPCRVISDSPTIAATAITSILKRMPRSADATVLPITCYVTDKGAPFAGFIVESGDGVVYGEDEVVASVVLTGSSYTPGKLSATIDQAAVALTE